MPSTQAGSGFWLSAKPLAVEVLKAAMRNPAAGALVTFEGWVRNHNEGKTVQKLEYEAYPPLALSEGNRIITEAKARYEICEAICIHRTGTLAVGEPAVWVGVSAAHRDAAYQASRYIIDNIKARVPIWKKEHYVDAPAVWVNCAACSGHAHSQAPEKSVKPTHPTTERYARQIQLPEIGTRGQEKLRRTKVLVVGAGGLGCAALQYLAAAGIGHLGICEPDKLEASNLNRQVLYNTADLGKNKGRLAAARLKAMNPAINVYLYEERLTKANLMKIISPYDLILDCTDNFPTKFMLNDAAVMMKKPLLQASVHQYEGQIHLYRPGKSACLRCLWPDAPRNGAMGGCKETGVLGPVPGLFGTLQAAEALKFILELPTPLEEHLLMMDLLTYRVQQLRRVKSAKCQHGEDYLLEPSKPDNVVPMAAARPAEPMPETPPAPAAVEQVTFMEADDTDDEDFEIELMPWSDVQLADFTLLDIREVHETQGATDNPLPPIDYIRLPYSRIDLDHPPLHPDRPYLLICQRGHHSAHLAAELRELGYREVYSLAGGLVRQPMHYLREVLALQESEARHARG